MLKELPMAKKSGRISGKKSRISARKSGRKSSVKRKKYVAAEVSREPFIAICSECYGEFVLNPRPDVQNIVCPDCDHGATAPSEEFLKKWTQVKKMSRKKLIISLVALGVLFLLGLIWMMLQINPLNFVDNDGMNYAFLFGAIVATGVFFYFGGTYEASRHEIYF